MVNAFYGAGYCVFIYYAKSWAAKAILRAQLAANLFYQRGFAGSHLCLKSKYSAAFSKA